MSKSKRKQRATGQRNLYLALGVIAAVVVIGIVAVILSQSGGAASYPAAISVAEAVEKRDEGAFILDVRTPEEWEEFHVPGSTLIPLDELESRVNEVPPDQEIVVVCRSGNRSQTGRDILRAAGLEQVTSMAGGLNEWKSAGYPTETGR